MKAQKDLRIALLQTELSWEDPKGNIHRIDQAINLLQAPVDVIVLPETWATGFTMHPSLHGMEWNPAMEQQLEHWPGPLASMLRWAQRCDAAVTGSLACHLPAESRCVNRCFFVTPEGELSYYDKKHLFTFHDEHLSYTPGNERKIVEWRGWRILLQVCYDLRFPVFSRNRKGNLYDLVIYVANWPAVRSNAWSALLPARAIENLAFVAGVNRVGVDGNGIDHDGRSVILDPYGQAIASLDPHQSSWIIGSCSGEELIRFRSRFPALSDADRFSLEP
ncbi:MAG: amidohydrolase [Flavobacteriales bacterium]